MKNIKLLPKLLGGFIIVALIVVAVGFFGVTGSTRLARELQNVARDVLPSATNLLKLKVAISEIHSADLALLAKGINNVAREEAVAKVLTGQEGGGCGAHCLRADSQDRSGDCTVGAVQDGLGILVEGS